MRIVYDGPPLSGKTTSVRALAKSLKVGVTTPAESDGRTLYFDWAEYVGGRYRGRPIHCQLLSVPGQSELAARRRALLQSADAIVFVMDSRQQSSQAALSLLSDLVPWLRAQSPPVGVVVQANKRDAEGALPRDALREHFDAIAPMALVETVATKGSGLREAFVVAVRLALDRTDALLEGGLELDDPSEEACSPEKLLEELRLLEGEEPSSPLSERDRFELSHDDTSGALPRDLAENGWMPDSSLPTGFIWPPVDGRAVLHEVAQLGIQPERTPLGDWWGSGGGWRVHSGASFCFEDLDAARSALIEWARRHVAYESCLSAGRVVVLASAGLGRWRLWQVVRLHQALREQLALCLASNDCEAVAAELAHAAERLLSARRRLDAGEGCLPCNLWTIGAGDAPLPRYVGLMPGPRSELGAEPRETLLIERELGPLLETLMRERSDAQDVLRRLAQLPQEGRMSDEVAHTLARLGRRGVPLKK